MKRLARMLRWMADRIDSPPAMARVDVQIQPIVCVSGVDSSNVKAFIDALNEHTARSRPFDPPASGLC